jgi:Tol biopolymer transport system component
MVVCLAAQEKKADDKKPTLPLKTDHKIEFTTGEGTWLSVDVSPDAKTVIFDLLGDLYSVPLGGGEAKLVMPGMAYDGQPKYSPDGSMIAFVSDRDGADNVWIAASDGSNPKQLSKEKQAEFVSPAWTPDGEYVLVSRSGSALEAHEVWMYNIHGGSGVQVTKSAATPQVPRDQRLRFAGAIASPDGKYFYYSQRKREFSYDVTFPLWQIFRKDRITGEEDQVTNAPGSAFRPVLSPDSKLLVYGTRYETETGLRIRNLASGEDRWLKYPVQRDDQESRATRDVLPGYAFTPDGKEIVICFQGKLHRLSVENGAEQPLPFTAHVSIDVGTQLRFESRVDEGPLKARLIQGAVPSPDGKRIAFSSLTHLYVMDLPGGQPVRVVSGGPGEYQPAWSPDGKTLAYVTWSADAGGQIWKAPADGSSAPQQLTQAAAFYREPVWTPDGARIAALRASRHERNEATVEEGEETTGTDLITVPGQGGDAQVIATSQGFSRPHFTTASDRIYVYSPKGLISMRFDGTDRRVHLKVIGKNWTGRPEPPQADEVMISPDGRFALALAHHQVYLLTIPVAGNETPTVDLSAPAVPIHKLSDVGADTFAWADGGQTITWSLGASFFRQALSTVSFDQDQKDEAAKDGQAKKDEDDKPKPRKPPQYEEIAVGIEAPRYTPQGTVVLRGARVITMKGDEVLTGADIVVTNNRIAGVGKTGSVKIPANARIIDVAGATIMPGIVDVHAHWTEIRRGVLDLESWPFLANLAYGVTSGRDPQTGTNDTFAYQDLIDMGVFPGPRAFSTGPGIFGAFAGDNVESLDEMRDIVARYKKYYRTNTVKSYVIGNRKQRQWMVEACKENGIMPTTEGALDLKLDMTHAIDGFSGNEHALPIVPLYKDVVELFSKTGIAYTPTLLVAYGGPFGENFFFENTEVHDDAKMRRFVPHSVLDEKTKRRPWFRKEEHVFPKLAASAAKVVQNGGHVTIGGHGEMQGIQCHWEMWALSSGGLTNQQVLRAATIDGARAIGYDQDLGSIETGKLADLVVLDKNPLDDIHNTTSIRYVMKNGEVFEGATLDEVWPEKKALPEMWWWKDDPAELTSSR